MFKPTKAKDVPFRPDASQAMSYFVGAKAVSDGIAITERDVRTAQKAWADAIKAISKTYLDGGDYVGAAGKAAGELYGYGHTNVMFKPTKAKDVPFEGSE